MNGVVLYGDECQNIVSNPTKITQYEKILNNLASEYRIFLSATPKRSDGMTKAMFALCGKIEHIISKDEVKDKTIKAVVKPVRTNFSIPTSALRYDGVIEYSKLSTILSIDKERNDLILNILNKEKDKYCLVLSDRLEGLEYLHNKFGNGVFINGKMTSKKAKEERKQAIEDMRNKKEHILFSTFALSKEGLDIKNLNVIILASPTKNDTVLIQSVGRIERKDEGKDTPIVYDLIDNDKYFEDAWKKRKTIYKKNGNIIMEE